MNRIIAAFMALAVLAPIATAQSPDKEAAPLQCVKPYQHNRYSRYVLQYSDRNGDYHANKPTKAQLHKLGDMRACALHKGDKVGYKKMFHYWHVRLKQWKYHAYIDRITPYGKWAIPTYIVMRESHGDRCAQNPHSTAGGYYQFLTSTWQAYGGTGTARCAPADIQHIIAHKAWNDPGTDHWALTR